MQKYRKKPVVVEAVQWNGKNVYEIYTFVEGKTDNTSCKMAEDRWFEYVGMMTNEKWKFKTLESDGETQKADVGDWIIKGVQGEFYPCKPDIFNATYEKVV